MCVCVCGAITVVPADFRSATLMLIKRAEKAAVVCKNRFSLVFSFLEGFSLFSPHPPPPPPPLLLLLRGIYPGKITFLGIESDPMNLREAHCHVGPFFP